MDLEFFPLFALPDFRAFSFFSFTCEDICNSSSPVSFLMGNLSLSNLYCFFVIIAVYRTVIGGATGTRIEVHVATLEKDVVSF